MVFDNKSDRQKNSCKKEVIAKKAKEKAAKKRARENKLLNLTPKKKEKKAA
jgi:hypothetical protein